MGLIKIFVSFSQLSWYTGLLQEIWFKASNFKQSQVIASDDTFFGIFLYYENLSMLFANLPPLDIGKLHFFQFNYLIPTNLTNKWVDFKDFHFLKIETHPTYWSKSCLTKY